MKYVRFTGLINFTSVSGIKHISHVTCRILHITRATSCVIFLKNISNISYVILIYITCVTYYKSHATCYAQYATLNMSISHEILNNGLFNKFTLYLLMTNFFDWLKVSISHPFYIPFSCISIHSNFNLTSVFCFGSISLHISFPLIFLYLTLV